MAKRTGSKVLLLSYFFPPAGGVSVQRMLALTKYLPRDRCEVGVLTTWNGAYPVSDPALLKRIPPDVKIHRAFTPELPYQLRRQLWEKLNGGAAKNTLAGAPVKNEVVAAPPLDAGEAGPNVLVRAKTALRDSIRRALLPDPQVVWRPFAERAAARLIQEEGYDTVLVTAPPFSSFCIGNALKRRFPHITLVSDFRDDWFGFYLNGVDSMASEEKRQNAVEIEKETVELSDLVVAVTDATRDDIRARYPAQPESKFQVIPNGYDPEAVPKVPPAQTRSDRMVITYVGTVYKPCSPRYFLDALDQVQDEIRGKIEVRFVGRVIDEEKHFLENRKAQLTQTGFVAQDVALRNMAESDYLLLVIDDPQTLSGKLFEYLATGKPILALTPPDSESAKLVRKVKSGVICQPRDLEAIGKMIVEAYQRFVAGQHPVQPEWEQIRGFERPRLADRYLSLMAAARPAERR
ncbi:MAG: glycosyltransferase [Myxococcota bacterium]|nr:glycosyltransferase [Myxococcota bacterium]